jgi:acetolactate synthase-1/2/3 large subunit
VKRTIQHRSARFEALLPGGLELEWLETEGGDELVVFVHAVGGDKSSWLGQLERLPRRLVGVALDLRGHGPRAAGATPADLMDRISVEGFADDVLALVDHLGFARAHLVGLSMGGVVAQHVLARAPERVASVTLASSWAHYGDAESAARNAYLDHRLSTQATMLEGSRGDMRYIFGEGAAEELVERAAQVEGGKDPEVFRRSWRSMFASDTRPLLARAQVPMLLVAAERDVLTPPSYLEAVRALVPTARLVVLPGATHFSNLSSPEAFEQALFPFLRENPERGGRHASLAPDVREVEADTTGHALTWMLSDRGVEVLFSNSGTDYVDVIDGLARYEEHPGFDLRVVQAPHENTVVSMAHGWFLATRRPAALMGHVNVGSANMHMGVINASRSRIPMLVLAGRTPWLDEGAPGCRRNFVQWGQDTFDQASFREFLKWDYELRTPRNLETTLDRALAITESDPAGPVYLMLPGEVLASELPAQPGVEPGRFRYAERARQRPSKAGPASSLDLDRAVELLRRAERPLVVTAELGRYPGGPLALARFAEALGVGVVEFGKHNFMNLPTDSPMHLGFDPVPAVRDADLVVAIECHVPYVPVFAQLERTPAMLQIGVDPLASRLPARGFPVDVGLSGDPVATLRALLDRLGDEPRAAERRARVAAEHERVFAGAHAEADADARLPRITKRYLSRVLGQVLPEDALIFNEYDLDPQLVPRTLPGTWFENSIASGLGWALGAALGAKLAMPERPVVATVGDGAYLFNVPLSAHFVAAEQRLPVLVVVFDDRAWSTIKRSTRGAVPKGHAVRRDRFPLTDFDADLDYAAVARAAGGIGYRVDTPGELEATLRRALDEIRTGDRLVLVDVRCERDG